MLFLLLIAVNAIFVNGADNKQVCERPPLTSPKTGQKAWDKCVEYQRLVYSCEEGSSGDASSTNLCSGNGGELTDFARHYALIGYEVGRDWQTRWLCGGTLISDRFILTAAHCLMGAYEYGDLKYIVLGTLKRSEADANTAHRYTMKKRIFNENFHSNFNHHDIGMLETNEQMKLSRTIVPACLHVGDSLEDDTAFTIGWGSSVHWTSTVDELQTMTLEKSTFKDCSANYPPTENNGNVKVNETFQLCYEDSTKSDKSCMSSGGSPLQMRNKKLSCMHTVIGVTASPRGCAFGKPGIFFRVSHYLPWIESVVWPDMAE